MPISNEDLTKIRYIETMLGIRFNGSTLGEVAMFIQNNLIKARKAEPTYHQLAMGGRFK